jgi:hypothetical protein
VDGSEDFIKGEFRIFYRDYNLKLNFNKD